MKKKAGKTASQQEDAEGGDEDMMELLDEKDEAADLEATFKVSAKYANKYNERKDKEELTRARRILADEDADHNTDSETESEDEGANLLTNKVEDKIFQTLNRIRSKDPAIYDKDKVFFDDDDFEDGGASGSSSKPSKREGGVRYKDFLRETLMREGADAIANEEEEMEAAVDSRGKTPKDEEREIRQNILSAAHGDDDEGDEGGEDDLFTLKEKTKIERKTEDEAFKAFKAKKEKVRNAEDVSSFWTEGEELDDNEKFLRDYVLNRAWQETTSLQPKGEDGEGGDSGDDEEHLDKQDGFEKTYNFRFEMEDGQQIQSHKRFQESSVRERPDKRKRQRAQKEERKESDKIRRTEELKRLKNLKKKEIMRRLQQLAEVTGNKEMPMDNLNLDKDFDPDAHDKEMSGLFGDQYDQGEELLDEDELARAPAGVMELDVSGAAEEDINKRRRKGAPKAKDGAGWEEAEEEGDIVEEVEEGDQEEEQGEVDPEEWWMCDLCQRGIPGGKRRFDCMVCENYTLCQKCFRIRRHPHKFTRKKVPEGSMPPEESKNAEPKRADMEEVLDEYFQLDYEDIIGGDLPTRFKYQKVKSNDCGMSADQILGKTDQELNRIVPLKKLRTYRTDDSKVRKEARWRARGGREQEPEVPQHLRQRTPATGSPKNGISAQRLQAYKLHADRKHQKGGKDGKGENKKGGSSKS